MAEGLVCPKEHTIRKVSNSEFTSSDAETFTVECDGKEIARAVFSHKDLVEIPYGPERWLSSVSLAHNYKWVSDELVRLRGLINELAEQC